MFMNNWAKPSLVSLRKKVETKAQTIKKQKPYFYYILGSHLVNG